MRIFQRVKESLLIVGVFIGGKLIKTGKRTFGLKFLGLFPNTSFFPNKNVILNF